MSDRKIYTPEGVQDILGDLSYGKRKIENEILQLFESFGYEEVQTPIVEFYDTFAVEKDLMPQEKMFKFFDAQGKILVLRPDMTIPVARIAATKLKKENALQRFSYIGNAFRYNEFGGGKQKEFTQAGVELLGDNSPNSDAEVIVLAINSLLKAGLSEFQIDIGQVEFFRGITEEAMLTPVQAENLRLFIDTKDYLGIGNFINELDIKDELKQLILSLPEFFGSLDAIDKAEQYVLNKKSIDALENVRETLKIIDGYGLSKYVSVDLGMVPGLDYYTGIIFRGFTYGIGFPVLSGGRYDNLVEKFGLKKPATGFSVGINMLMNALLRQYGSTVLEKPKTDILFYTDRDSVITGYELCKKLRSVGYTVEVMFAGNNPENSQKSKYKMIIKFSNDKVEITDCLHSESLIVYTTDEFSEKFIRRAKE